MARNQHEKLSDLYKYGGPFLGERTTFAKAHPTIEEIGVAIEIDGKVPYGAGHSYVLDKTSVREHFDCPNTQCTRGGFYLGRLIDDMIYEQETTREAELRCEGYEGSPKGRKYYGSCGTFFKVRITIRYKQMEQASPGPLGQARTNP